MLHQGATAEQRLRRLARYLYIGAALLAIFYAVGVNAFLLLNGTNLLFRSTNTVNATYGRAYSIWPGVVHVHNLRVVFQDKNVEFSLDIERATVRIALAELLQRRFHVKWLTGSGAAFRFRHRIEPESQQATWVSALPVIRGFRTPAVFEPTVPEPPIPDDRYNLWTVHIEKVDVSIRELWVQFVRYVGTARVRGSFRLVPARTLWVGPASLELYTGRMMFGNTPLATSVSGKIDCRVDFFDVRIPQGRDVFRYINTGIELRARDFRFDPFVQFFAPPQVAVNTTGSLQADIHVIRGRIARNTKIKFAADRVQVTAGPLAFETPAAQLVYETTDSSTARLECSAGHARLESSTILDNIDARIDIAGSDLTSDFSVKSSSLTIGKLEVLDARSFAPLLSVYRLPVTVESGGLQATLALVRTAQETRVRLDASHFDLQGEHAGKRVSADGSLYAELRTQTTHEQGLTVDVSALFEKAAIRMSARADSTVTRGNLQRMAVNAKYRYVNPRRDLQFHAEIASLSASRADQVWVGRNFNIRGQLAEDHRSISGDIAVTLDTFRVGSPKLTLKLRPAVSIAFRGFDKRRREGKLHATLNLGAWSASYGDDGGQCSSLIVPGAHLDMVAFLRDGTVASRLNASVNGVQLQWGKDFSARTDIELVSHLNAERRTGKPKSIWASARLLNSTFVSGHGTTDGWSVTSPDIEIGSRASYGTRLVGTLAIGVRRAVGRVGHVLIGTSVDANVPEFVLGRSGEPMNVGAQVRIHDTSLRTNTQQISNWWANIDVPSTQLTARQNLDISARFHAAARDATPGLVVLDEMRQVPSWLKTALPLREVRSDGYVARRCRLTAIRFDRISGGPLTGRGTLLSANDVLRGAFLVRLKEAELLSAGIEIGPPDAGVSPLVSDDWLHKHTSRLDNAAEQTLSKPCHIEPQRCASTK